MGYRYNPQNTTKLQEGADKIDTIFTATYNSTTYTEVQSAVNAGMFCFAVKSALTYHYVGLVSGVYYFARQTYDGTDSGNKLIAVNSSNTWSEVDGNLAPKSYVEQLYWNSLMEDTVSGSICSFPDGANDVPIRSMKGLITPIQSGSGDPSPDNVRPIQGYTGANISVTGKNLLRTTLAHMKEINTSGTWSNNVYTLNSVTFTVNETNDVVTSIVINGTSNGTPLLMIDTNLADYLPQGEQYKLSGCPSGGSSSTYFALLRYAGYDTGNGLTFAAPAVAAVHCSIGLASGVHANNLVFKPMITLATETDSDYAHFEPYIGTITAISWQTEAGTVYGDEFDVDASGAVKLDKGHDNVTINGSEGYTWSIDNTNANYTTVYATPERTNIIIPNHVVPAESSDTSVRIICDKLKGAPRAGLNSAGCVCIQGGSYCVLMFTLSKSYNITTSAEVNTWLTSNNLQLVYELATPQTYTLSSVADIKTVLGANNVWVDTGDIEELIYRCNTALYIEKKLGA